MTGIRAIRLVTQDARRLATFYADALGFRVEPTDTSPPDPFSPLGRRVTLTLGAQRIELVEPEEPVADTGPVTANDVRFQHFALVATDMARAHDRLSRTSGWSAITQGGPQRLPESSGGVTAFKFRDPDGHPLEFLAFPPDAVPDRWAGQRPDGDGALLGIDHTAITVTDTARSLSHYAALGLRKVGGSINTGPAQAALDGVPAPRVEVTRLQAEGARPPHVELLCYGETHGTTTGDTDLLATRILGAAGTTALRDPDGHRWIGATDSEA